MKPIVALLLAIVAGGAVRADEPTPTGAVFQDCGDCPEMVVLPAGEVMIGATADDLALIASPESAALEQPRHKATLHRFAIGRAPVTRAQFSAFTFETGYRPTSGCGTFDLKAGTFQEHAINGWLDPGFVQGDRDPVVCVSYRDAAAYVAWLVRKTRRPYRLPSEVEWEYAARAGTTGPRPWSVDDTCRYANVADRAAVTAGFPAMEAFACDDGRVTAAPVASYAPNAFGLHDTLGNVAQWTADCLNPNYDGAPTDGTARTGAADCARVIRGGGWMAGPAGVRAARRASNPQTWRDNGLGFRVAREIDVPAE